MSHDTLIQISGILIVGVAAQWAAWRIGVPSILLLLAAGFLVGPLTGFLQPDELFSVTLLPTVSLLVAVILYEGGLNLDLREIRHVGTTLFLITTLGAAVSWFVGATAAHYLAGLDWPIAVLLASILVVTGPTVIGPILRHIRLRGRAGALLKWEGILIDPLGATLAILVFSVVHARDIGAGLREALLALGLTLMIGVGFGLIGAALLILALARFWIPDYLRNPVSLMLVLLVFVSADLIQDESGLLAVTIMGIAVANQRRVSIHPLVMFYETVTTLIVACLFVILSARVNLEELRTLGFYDVLFVLVMIVVARPLSVALSTWASQLNWREKLFLACMSPRGIVAASVSSIFALSLINNGHLGAVRMVPLTFLLILSTVLFSGLISAPLARYLRLVAVNPHGILFVGATPCARALAKALNEEGIPTFLVDTDRDAIRDARMSGLRCLHGNALTEWSRERIDMDGLGRMFAVTSSDHLNALACMNFAEDFGWGEVYQLSLPSRKEGLREMFPREHRGRQLFQPDLSYEQIWELAGPKPTIKKTKLTVEFDYNSFQNQHGQCVVPLLLLKPGGGLTIRTAGAAIAPQPGDLLFSLNLLKV